MPRKTNQPNANPIHQSLWVLKQLHHGGNPEHFVNFRCIHNGATYLDSTTGRKVSPSEPTLDTFVKLRDLEKTWNESLLNQLNYQNFYSQKPANIYFAINPIKEKGHKKENFAGFTAFYLDLDDNLAYNYQQRYSQIYFWSMLGFKPSFVVGSGHGFHVYWLLTHMLERAEGEALLKRMVALSDCRSGGNVFDISRVFRLPGFLNVKKWAENDKPGCALLIPEHTPETLANITAEKFEPSKFENFPPSSVADLERYYNEARRLSANDPAQFETKVQQVLAGALQIMRQNEAATATTAGAAVAVQNQTLAQAQNTALTPFAPRFSVVPPAKDLKWGSGEVWMRKYCVHGHDGMTQGELDALVQKHNWTDSSASALDLKIMYALCKKLYSKDAIREFWVRPENKLYRPDKEAKNANYFSLTYDTAFGYAKAAYEQNAKGGHSGAHKIMVDHFQTFLKNGDEGADLLITAALKLNEIFVDEDALKSNLRELYDMDITYIDPALADGTKTLNRVIPHSAFCDVKNFRDHCEDLFCCMTGNTSDLQYLIQYLRLTFRNAKTRAFHSKLVFADNKFVFPTYTISKDAITQHDVSAVSQHVEKRIPMLGLFGVKFLPLEQTITQLKTFWGDTLRVHLPRVVASTLGFIAAGAISPIFEQQLCVQWNTPTINIRGPSNTAKTATVSHLCTFTGIRFGKNIHSVKSSEFAIAELLAATNYLPIGFDEFKEELGNEKHLANIRQLVRRMYTGEAIVKGRRDMSIVSTCLHGGAFILGELAVERIGDVSEISRLLPIDSDGFSIYAPENHARWLRLAEVYWCELGPLFYKWLLNQDIPALYGQFKQLREEVVGMIEKSFAGERYRIANNLGVIWFGCRLIDGFIKSLWPDAPTIEEVCRPRDSLVEYLCNWSKTVGQSLTATVLVPQAQADPNAPALPPVEETQVFSANELFTVVKTYGTMIESRDKAIRDLDVADVICYHENENKEQLWIPFHTMYNAVTMFYRMHGRIMPSEGKLRALINYAKENNDIWIIESNKVVSVRGQHFRALILNVRMLRQMGVWPSKTLLTKQAPGAPQNAEHPNMAED